MKVLLQKLGKKVGLVAVAALLAGSGATAGVFAAIPHSESGVISGCRANADGALRVIDAQAGASCDVDETPLNWGDTPQTAVAAAYVPMNETPALLPNLTRNISNVKFVDKPEEYVKYICLDLPFTPKFANGQMAYMSTDYAGAQADVDAMCEDTGFDVAIPKGGYLADYSFRTWFSS